MESCLSNNTIKRIFLHQGLDIGVGNEMNFLPWHFVSYYLPSFSAVTSHDREPSTALEFRSAKFQVSTSPPWHFSLFICHVKSNHFLRNVEKMKLDNLTHLEFSHQCSSRGKPFQIQSKDWFLKNIAGKTLKTLKCYKHSNNMFSSL